MAVSSISGTNITGINIARGNNSGTTYGSSTRLSSAACPTCGGSVSRVNTAQAFAGNNYSGRATDSFACSTCGLQRGVPGSANSVSSRTTTSSTSYCPTCNRTNSNNTAGNSVSRSTVARTTFTNTVAQTRTPQVYGQASCPTCGTAATRVATNNINTISWAR